MNTLHDYFIQIFGTYSPITSTDPVTGQVTEFTDWSYIFSCVMAAIALYCVLRILGICFSSSRR